MRRILGTKDQYFVQTNNAQVELFRDYFKKGKMIACGPTAAAMGLAIAGWPLDVFTPGEQPEDSILMVLHNPAHLADYKKRRDIDYDIYPPNEVAQLYEVALEKIYRQPVCRFDFGLSFDIIRENILASRPIQVCGNFPAGGHYVLVVGFDDEKHDIIFNDPYPIQWPDRNGYNREMSLDFFNTKLQKHRIIYNHYQRAS